MREIEIEIGPVKVRALSWPSQATAGLLLAGPGRLMGWSFRESGAESAFDVESTTLAPGAGVTVAQILNVPAGLYVASWEVQLIGAAAAADQDNFALFDGATQLSTSLNAGAAGQYPQTPVQFTNPASSTIAVKAIGAATAGVTYGAQISLAPVITGQSALELRDGNSVLAEISAATAGELTAWLGPQGIDFYNGISGVVVSGSMIGAVYAAFHR
jgi:hypothetical protein